MKVTLSYTVGRTWRADLGFGPRSLLQLRRWPFEAERRIRDRSFNGAISELGVRGVWLHAYQRPGRKSRNLFITSVSLDSLLEQLSHLLLAWADVHHSEDPK